MTEINLISISLLDFNKGQLQGLPKNPRFFRDNRYEAMKKKYFRLPGDAGVKRTYSVPI